jgi:hypothetical protein
MHGKCLIEHKQSNEWVSTIHPESRFPPSSRDEISFNANALEIPRQDDHGPPRAKVGNLENLSHGRPQKEVGKT